MLVRAVLGGAVVAEWAPINPVPYAHFATSAGTATRLTRGPRVLWDRLETEVQFFRPDGGPNLEVPIMGLSVTLPDAGTYLLVLNLRFFGQGRGISDTREDLAAVRLVVRDRTIATQSLPGYYGEVARQRSGGATIVVPYTASAGDVVNVVALAAPGVSSLQIPASASNNDHAYLVAIPMDDGR